MPHVMIAETRIDDPSTDAIEAAMSGLAAQSRVDLEENPDIPSLYDAAARGVVRYQRERPEAQTWWVPSRVIERGWGDCKHFAAWRVAELRRQGRKAMIAIIDRRDAQHPGRWHAVVEHDSGEIEDPARKVILIARQRESGGPALVGADAMRTEIMIKRNPKARGRKNRFRAALGVPVWPAHKVALACVGDTRAEALDRVAQLASGLINDPTFAALIPGPAVAAIAGAGIIARAARSGTLDQLMSTITKPGQLLIANTLHDEMTSSESAQLREHRRSSAAPAPGGSMSTPATPARTSSTSRRRRVSMDLDDVGAGNVDCIGPRGNIPDYHWTNHCAPQCVDANGRMITNAQCLDGQPRQTSTVARDRFGNPIKPSIPPMVVIKPSAHLPTSSGAPSGATTSGRTPLVDPATGQPIVDPTTGQPYTAATMPEGMLDPSGSWIWTQGHWERPRGGAAQQPFPPPGAGSYGYGYADPYGAWGAGMDPYVWPGQQPFMPGWYPYAPSAPTSNYPPPYEGGGYGVEMPAPDASAMYSQQALEAMFNGGAWWPSQTDPGNWPEQFNYGNFMADVGADRADLIRVARESGYLSDVGASASYRVPGRVGEPQMMDDLAAAGGDPERADIVRVARESGWLAEHAGTLGPRGAGAGDVADVSDVGDVHADDGAVE